MIKNTVYIGAVERQCRPAPDGSGHTVSSHSEVPKLDDAEERRIKTTAGREILWRYCPVSDYLGSLSCSLSVWGVLLPGSHFPPFRFLAQTIRPLVPFSQKASLALSPS